MYNENIYVEKYVDQDVVVGWFKRPENTDLLQEVFSEYKNQKVFVNWVSVFNGTETDGSYKKPKKVPFNPYTEKNASVDKPKTWVRLEGAINDGLRNTRKINGIGIVLNETDLTVIDVDQIIDNSGTVVTDNVTDLPIIKELIKKFNSYTEISPSGKGIHIFIKGKIKPNDDEETTKNGSFKYDGYTAKYEFFDGVTFSKGRFVTVTGDVVDGYDKISSVDTDVLREFAVNGGNIKKIDQKYTAEYNNTCIETATKDDDEILAIVQDHRLFNPDNILFTDSNGSKLIVNVNDSGYEILPDDTDTNGFIDYKSPSEYDIALMGIISYLTKDPAQIGRVFRSSKYFKCFRFMRDRAKCKRVEYWKTTIKAAIKYAANHPEYNPFRFADLDTMYKHVHNKQYTDKDFVEYLMNKGTLNYIRMLCVGKSDDDSQFIKYNKNIGCWDTQHGSVTALTDVIYVEVDRLIKLIEEKRTEEEEALQKKIEAVESAGKKWDGSRELPPDPVYSYLVGLYNSRGINSLIHFIKKLSVLQTFMEDYNTLDNCGDYLFFEDCKLDLNTGEWLDSTPDDMNSKSCALKVKPYLNEDGTIKTDGTVQKYIHDFFTPTFGDNKGIFQEEYYKLFMGAIGASLYGYIKEKYFYFLYGEGNTGKSVLMESLGTALGGDSDRGYYMPLVSSFFSQDRGGNNDSLYYSNGRRFGLSSEMETVTKMKNDVMKAYSGNAFVRVSAKYMRQISFVMAMSIFIETNELPYISNGLDAALFNRLVIIKCEHRVDVKNQDKNLRKKLVADVGGWVWLLKTACDIYRSDGIVIPQEAEEAKSEYVKELSTIEQFAQEFLEFTGNENDKIPSGDLYTEYTRFYTDIEYGLGKKEQYIESKDKFLKDLKKAAKDIKIYSKQFKDKAHPKGRQYFTVGVKFKDIDAPETAAPSFTLDDEDSIPF